MSDSRERCLRCNEIHDQSPVAAAMCRAAAAVLDEDHRPAFRRAEYRTLLTDYRRAYDAWSAATRCQHPASTVQAPEEHP